MDRDDSNYNYTITLVLLVVIWITGAVTGWYYGRKALMDGLIRKTISKTLNPDELHAQA